jgi:hypothetical protein
LRLLGSGWEGSDHPAVILDLVSASRCSFAHVTARSGKVACYISEETDNARNSM